MKQLSSLELKVLTMLLDGDSKELSILRDQLKMASVAERQTTGAGFYTKLTVPNEVAKLANSLSTKFGDVEGDIPGLNFGAGFLLYIKDGVLHMLEGYSYEEPWPKEISTFKLKYSSGQKRDTQAIDAKLKA